ncbi:hypothetical protein KFK09_012949 [Dendrobium nobile]|uniref:Uncharacterized protein n=1 Tax=Dendrobium nobile TaxID=94219 RepID=A0A8T3BJ70_DENNO|nr:hypothetical protein KFK09_012949 [Dendrobium nobile]
MEFWIPFDSDSLADAYSPEKKLTVVALRLAILEKAACGVGALGFIWATVVLLGGFAIALQRTDFWFVTVILLVEGARIFSRSHELEWQHQATWSLTEAGAFSFRAIRSSSRSAARAFRFLFETSGPRGAVVGTPVGLPVSVDGRRWRSPELLSCFTRKSDPRSSANRTGQSRESPRHPNGGWVFISSNISRLLYWLQLISATACVILSLMRLVQQDYGEVSAAADKTEKQNRGPALNIFYSLALSEALLFLAERAYWEWKVSRCLLLEEANRECGLGPAGLVSVRRFFYDAYSRCINGSIFDGIKMDMVSFGEELLVSGSRDEQLIGVRILLRFADKAMRRIGASVAVMERLVEMLNWKSSGEEEIRTAAAVVVSKLAGKKQSGIRVAGITGAMESISSLLDTGSGANATRLEEINGRQVTADRPEKNQHSTFNLLGLLILKKLAKDPDNCDKIGKTKGLIPKIIDFTTAISRKIRHQNPIASTDPEIQAAKRALQVLKLLAGTTGRTGEILRREISEIVFTISNIREILKHGEDEISKSLQTIGVEIITFLAMDEAARESIGATGGMMRELMRIFLDCAGPAVSAGGDGGRDRHVRMEAGEALAMLVVESERNCERVLRVGENVVERLVDAAGDSLIGAKASRLLSYLCAYGEVANGFQRMKAVIKAFPMVLNAMMIGEAKQLEVSIGFAVRIVRFMSPIDFIEELERANVSEIELIKRLVHILQKYNVPSIRTPSMRRNVIELSIWLMQSNEKYIKLFNNYEMANELQNVAETTADLECFVVFSGSVGLTRHRTTMAFLVDTALELLLED